MLNCRASENTPHPLRLSHLRLACGIAQAMAGDKENSEKDQKEPKDELTQDDKQEKAENRLVKSLFNDLKQFKNLKVTIFLYGGDCLHGKLVEYDEVANCVLEMDDKQRKAVVLGRAITMICKGSVLAL